MQVIKERLKWSVITLLTIPYAFIIICGVISLSSIDIYKYTNYIVMIFLGLIGLLTLISLYHYMLLRKLKKKSGTVIVEETKQNEEGINEFANVIGKDTQFIGDIHTTNDVLILGSVKGLIQTTADVYVDGMAEGSITCRNLSMNEAVVNADIDCYKEVFVDALSLVRGNIHTDVLIHHGKIKGNIDIEGHMELSNHCVILGDISAHEIALPPGVQIHGTMNIKK